MQMTNTVWCKVESICGICSGPENNETPQLSVLHDDGWMVCCRECWSKQPVWRRNPSARPPRLAWRWLQRLYAKAHGYYWMPCPGCGRMFGGHEAHGKPVPTDKPWLSLSTCSNCR
jgi:hypothetical protein